MTKTKIKNHPNTCSIRSVYKLYSQIYLRKKNYKKMHRHHLCASSAREILYNLAECLIYTMHAYMSVRDLPVQCHERSRRQSAWRVLSKWNRHRFLSYVNLPGLWAKFSRLLLSDSSNTYASLASLLEEKLSVPLNCLYQTHTEVFDLHPEKPLPGKSGLFWMNHSKHCAFSCVFMAADLKVTQ